MSRIRTTVLGAAAGLALLCGAAGARAADQHVVWKLPTYLAEGLQVKMETRATEDLLKRAEVQCIDDACKQDLARCKANMAKCLLVPSREAVQENERENN